MNSFDLNLLLQGPYHEMLWQGFYLSLRLLWLSWTLAITLGLLLALARLSPWSAVSYPARSVIALIRNIPLLVHLLFWYFAVPEFLPESCRDYLYQQQFETWAAVAALSLYASAYMAEDLRSGISAIPAQQTEAARSLGLSYLATLRRVILPQAWRISLAPILSQTLNLWKSTSVATVIGTAELMYQAAKVETATFRSAEAFAFASLAYLSVSLFISVLSYACQRRLSLANKPA